MGRRVVSSFARDLGSGRLVGYTSIQVPGHAPALAFQHDTLVIREHRGHGLGLALKLANLRVLAERLPEVRTVRTWNAAENAHMLAVNTAMGFRPSGRLRTWQRHLAG
jgi:GNAT superfamily N-acetyltransferase